MFSIINIYKGLTMFDEMVRVGDFHKALHLDIKNNFELFNKKILIVGFGRIGKKLIKRCLGFDMEVLVYDPYVDSSIINSMNGRKIQNLEDALKEADIISLKGLSLFF